METTRIFKAADITAEVGVAAFTALLTSGVWTALVPAPFPSRGERRLVLAEFHENLYKTPEIMIALEGEGCMFLRATDNLNKFVFITGGLDMQSAELVERLFQVIGTARAEVEAFNRQKYPQLQHHEEAQGASE